MKPYIFSVPTMFFFGKNAVKENECVIQKYGKRACIVTSRFIDGCENLALKDVRNALDDLGIVYEVTEDVVENPSISSIVSMTKKIRAFEPDFIVGAGGGSSIDSAKAISVLLEHPAECDDMDKAAEIFYEGAMAHTALWSEGKVPVLAVPTTAGTGAEVTAFAVLTNDKTHKKLAMTHPVFCAAAFLDARYIEHAPEIIIHTGAMDALAHGIESYVNKKGTDMSRSIAEIGFRLFADVKDRMTERRLTDSDYEKLMMFSNLMGMAFMRSGTTIPHGMGYALSTYKGVNHGLSCSVTLGEYLKIFKEAENQTRALRAVNLCGFETLNDFSEYISEIIARDLHITVTKEELEQWSVDFFDMKYRLTKHPETITQKDIRRIYFDSLKKYLVS